MKFVKIFGTVLVILLVAAIAPAFGKFIVQPKVTVQISSPTSNEHVTSAIFVISGSATAKASIAGVFYQLNTDDWTAANLVDGGKKWNAVVALDAGTNTLLVYARDTSGNFSSTNTVKFFYDLAVKSLTGLTVFATNDVDALALSFSTNTFSESSDTMNENGVGTYTYSKVNSSTGRVTLTFSSPPMLPASKLILNLQFTNNNSGSFTNDGDTFFFTISDSPTLVTTNALGTVVLDADGGGEIVLVFPPPSTIFDNGHLFSVKNPMAIPLDGPFAGNPGDRVSVDIAHYGFSLDAWHFINTLKDSGTVLSFGENSGGADTVTVFFDSALFVSSKDAFIPKAGGFVNDLSYFATNSGDGTVTPGGAFSYKVYSPIGALLTAANDDGSTNYIILTFTDIDLGNYFFDTADATGVTDEGQGTFNLTSTFNGGGGGGETNLAPATVTGNNLVATNGDGFFERVDFINDVAFSETNSFNMTNSAGNYSYTNDSPTTAIIELDFTSGANGFTNFIDLTFVTNNAGSFSNSISDSSSSTNFTGTFRLH